MYVCRSVDALLGVECVCRPKSSSTDEIFVAKAAQAGLAEVADGRLAIANVSKSAIRTIGQRMVTDHTKANELLALIARADSLIVPAMPNANDRAIIAKHKMLSGSAFDAAYLKGQNQRISKLSTSFNDEVAQGSNPRLLAFAKETLPTIQMHLKMFQAARGSM